MTKNLNNKVNIIHFILTCRRDNLMVPRQRQEEVTPPPRFHRRHRLVLIQYTTKVATFISNIPLLNNTIRLFKLLTMCIKTYNINADCPVVHLGN